MLITTIEIHTRPDKKREIIQPLLELTQQEKFLDNYESSTHYQDLGNPNHYYFIKKRKTVEDLTNYKRSQSLQIFLGIESLLEESMTINHGVECDMLKIYQQVTGYNNERRDDRGQK